jgi:hypothetical protein
MQSKAPISVQVYDKTHIPRDHVNLIAERLSVPDIVALRKTCTFFRGMLSDNQWGLPMRLGYALSRGDELGAKRLLEQAKKANVDLTKLLRTETIITDSCNQKSRKMPLYQHPLWSGDKYIFNLFKSFVAQSTLDDFILEYAKTQKMLQFTAESLNQAWATFHALTARIDWAAFKRGSETDIELQACFQTVAAAMAELPGYWLNQIINTSRSLLPQGREPKFDDPKLTRSLDIDETHHVNVLAKDNAFGRKFGALRLMDKAVAVNIEDISDYAQIKVNVNGQVFSITQINANAIKALQKASTTWLTDITTKSRNNLASSQLHRNALTA